MKSTFADTFSHILSLETYEQVRGVSEFICWVKWVGDEFKKSKELHFLYKNKKHILIKRFIDEALPLSKWLNFHADVVKGKEICLLSSSQKFDAVLLDNGLVTDRIEITRAVSFNKNEVNTVEDKIELIQSVLNKKLVKNYGEPTTLLIYSHYFDELDSEEVKRRLINLNIPKIFKYIYLTGNDCSLTFHLGY